MMNVLVSYGLSKKKVWLESQDELTEKLATIFGLNKDSYFLQLYDSDIDDFLDMTDDDKLQPLAKLKVVMMKDHVTSMEPVNEEQAAPVSVQKPSSDGKDLPQDDVDASNKRKDENQFRCRQWPEHFTISEQSFSPLLTELLRKGKPLNWQAKFELMSTLSSCVYKYTAFPSIRQRQDVCKTLISKYPHLREELGSGFDGWQECLNNKMKKLRHDLQTVREEVRVVKKRASTPGKSPGKTSKTPKRGELNWAPDHLDGEDDNSLRKHKERMAKEMKRPTGQRKTTILESSMNVTYSFRRSFINENPSLATLKEQYPALFVCDEQFREMKRLTGVNVMKTFSEELAKVCLKMVNVAESTKGKGGEYRTSTLKNLKVHNREADERSSLYRHGVAAIQLLPNLLQEETSDFLVVEEDSKNIKRCVEEAVEPMVICHGDPHEADRWTFCAEKQVLIDVEECYAAICTLFCVFYTCNIEYPKALKNTFNFIQHKLLGIKGCACPAKVISLANKLK